MPLYEIYQTMSDAEIAGGFTIAGVIIGFCLSQIADYIKERRNRRHTRDLLKVKLLVLQSAIRALKVEVEETKEIKNSSDLKNITDLLKKSELHSKIKIILNLSEKSIIPDLKTPDLVNPITFAKLERIRINIKQILLETDTSKCGDEQILVFNEDLKPRLISLSADILENINLILTTMDKI